jgi:hypothetical protein
MGFYESQMMPPQSLRFCAANPHTQTPAASDHSINPRAAGHGSEKIGTPASML